MPVSSPKKMKAQPKDMIFTLDIGTRSIIGIVGTVQGEKLRIIAMEKEEHAQRSMIDGQIEDIEQVAKVAGVVKHRLEEKLGCKLKRVCVAAAGRALRTQRASFEIEFPQLQRLDEETVCRLEAGAIGEAETAFACGQETESHQQFLLVGHTTVQYYVDNYPITNLLGHQARQIKADVIATFLPSEVVESLYTTMQRINLEVSSLTLEPIAAINAVIPKNLRLLNLALVDIGAGTSDIAVTRDGGVVGYTMVTVAGDEITEALMKKYLLDFNTAEWIKTQLGHQKSVLFTDILGVEQNITQEDMLDCIKDSTVNLCQEISKNICEVNGGPASAVFLAGGGSKLEGLRDGIAKSMNMDINRVAIAGNNFYTYAESEDYDLNDPEYATPLGIAISAGLNLITESFHVTLNGSRAKLFRSNTMTILDILMMNGFTYQQLLPRTGQKLVVQLNGEQTVFYGAPGEPAVLRLNGREAKISEFVHTGDSIEFIPATQGRPAAPRLKDLIADNPDQPATVNGKNVSVNTRLKSGDVIIMQSGTTAPGEDYPLNITETSNEAPRNSSPKKKQAESAVKNTAKSSANTEPVSAEPPLNPRESAGAAAQPKNIEFILNNKRLLLSEKPDGSPYYLMDLVEQSGIDTEHPTGKIALLVNGDEKPFLHELTSGDQVDIFFKS